MEHARDLAGGTHAWMWPDVAFEEREMDALIDRTLTVLPPTCRRVYEMIRAYDLSYQEVARALGISRSAVSNHIVLAQRRFRVALTEHGITPPPRAIGRAKTVDDRTGDTAAPKSDASQQRVDNAA